MNRIIKIIFTIMLLASSHLMWAQNDNASAIDVAAVMSDITSAYQPWENVEFNGKLRYAKLPISPSVKMYMVRDSLIQISLRVPILGEQARITVDRDCITAVNKMKGTYCCESMDNLQKLYPGIISDIQSIFLSRVVILGMGEMKGEHAEIIGIEPDGEDGWLIIPITEPGLIDFNYGYDVTSSGRNKAFMAALPGKNIDISLLYSYPGSGECLDLDLNIKGKQIKGQLDFSSVRWGGSEMSPIKLEKYKRMSLKEFISSF